MLPSLISSSATKQPLHLSPKFLLSSTLIRGAVEMRFEPGAKAASEKMERPAWGVVRMEREEGRSR
jgi:hypothetical protein